MKYIYDSGEFSLEVNSDIQEASVVNSETVILYLLEGEIDICIGDAVYNMKSEDIKIINRNSNYKVVPYKNILLCSIIISSEILRKYVQLEYSMFWCRYVNQNDENYNLLKRKLKEFLDTAISLPEGKLNVHMSCIFYEILECLFQNFLISNNNKGMIKKDDERKNKIALYVEQNYRTHINLNKLADELFLTYHYLSRNFKNMFGVNFNEYINSIRLRHVINDLLYTRKNMMEIAMDNGFTSSSVLNRIFKNTYNMTPSEFRDSFKIGKDKEILVGNMKDLQILEQNMEYIDNLEDKISKPIEKSIISVDVTKNSSYKRVFNKMINVGFAPDLLFAGVQEHIVLLKNEIGFNYIRLWNIFHKKMDLQENYRTTNLNFEKIDYILDFLVKNNLKPFIEFGNKPKIIVNDLESFDFDEMSKIDAQQFENKEEFSQLLELFINHIIERYGVKEVKTWKYEFWNDFIFPVRRWSEEDINYFQVFDIAYKVIKSRLPDAEIGGCGTPGDEISESFYREWAEHMKPDFISIMVYPYRISDKNRAYETDAEVFSKIVEKLKEYLKIANITCKVYVTEWNSTVSSRNYQNDSCYQAAYCVKNAVDVLEKVDLVGFWLGSDRFTSSYNDIKPINGGSGLLTKDGIMKPAFFSFQFLNMLYDNLICSEGNAVITGDGCGNYAILCHNYRYKDYRYYMSSEMQRNVEEYTKKYDDKENVILEFILEGVEAGNYRVSIYEISPSKGNILEEWKKLNFESGLKQEELEYLKRTCRPFLSLHKVEVKEDKVFSFMMELESDEIALLKIYKI